MNGYVATFFSHFGAVQFKKACTEKGCPARLMPVPRSLSSSCGTCVRFESEEPPAGLPEDAEQVCLEENGAYRCLLRAENS